MADYFYIHNKDRKPPYTDTGIVLNEIKEPKIIYTLNGICRLSFKYPLVGDEKRSCLLKINNIVAYKGKGFRIKTLTQTHDANTAPCVLVEAQDFLADLNDYIIPDCFLIGKTPRQMLTESLKNTPFHVMTPEELSKKDMQWWDVPTDLELGRTTPAKVIESVISNTGGGEIYLDNYNIAIVKEIGKKRIRPIRIGVNLKSVERAVDGRELMTRVYPIGQDGLHIDYVTAGGQQYIDSKWAEVFGVIEGYAEYNDIKALGEDNAESMDGASVLYWTAAANMDAPVHCGNSELKADKNKYVNTAGIRHKLDLPMIEYSVSYTDMELLKGDETYHFELGDTVRIIDELFGVDTGNPGEKDYLNLQQQIIEIENYPMDPRKNNIKLGQHKKTYITAIYDGHNSAEYIGNHTDKDKDIREDCTEGSERTDLITVSPKDGSCTITDRFGVRSMGHVYYDDYRNPQYAVCISKSVIAMGRKRSGKWIWSNVIAQGMGNLDGAMWTGQLFTENVSVRSGDGNLMIEGTAITMKDAQGHVRFKCGLDKTDGKFKFVLCDNAENPTVYMQDSGDVVFAGTVNTGKDATIGSHLYLKDMYTSPEGNDIGASLWVADLGDFYIKANKSRTINIETDGNIELESGNDIRLTGKNLTWNGDNLPTVDDLDRIEGRLKDIENRLSQLGV